MTDTLCYDAPMKTNRGTALRRFWEKVSIEDGPLPTQCWIWTAGVTKDGYGRFRPVAGETMKLAHRWAMEQFCYPLSDDLEVDHLCKVRNCVNPDHLEDVNRDENMRRARKTHCKWGHELSEENVYVTPKGHRQCRECGNGAQRAYQKRLREAAARNVED